MPCTSSSACLAVKLCQVLGRPHTVRCCSGVLPGTRCSVTMSACTWGLAAACMPSLTPMACSRLISSHAFCHWKHGRMHQSCQCAQP